MYTKEREQLTLCDVILWSIYINNVNFWKEWTVYRTFTVHKWTAVL